MRQLRVVAMFMVCACIGQGSDAVVEARQLPSSTSQSEPQLQDSSSLASAPGAIPGHAATMALLAADRRQFEAAGPGQLTAHIPGVLHAELTGDGLLARADGDELGLATVSYGPIPLGGTEPTLGNCAPTSELVGDHCAPAAELDHGLLTEWWASSASGVHQGWTLHAPADPSSPVAELHLATTRGELFEVDTDGQGAWFEGHTGNLWRYDDLSAWDATGRRLEVRLRDAGAELTVVVDVLGAAWPVTVDPSLTPSLSVEDKLVASDGASSDYFAYSVSGAGDVNGDGYDDLVVGARLDDDDGSASGSAYVYYGTSTGIDSASEDKVVASDGAENDDFGMTVSGAGDVDGDGYDDLVVSALGCYDDNGWLSGCIYVYYGSSTGIDSASEDRLVASDGAEQDRFGHSVSGAGDVDGDGYDDLVVGAMFDDDYGDDSGSVYVYYGSSTGIDSASEDKVVASDGAAGDRFGGSVSGAGDVNSDGYDDVVVGASGEDYGGNGSVYVYYGSSTGIDSASEDNVVASDGASEDSFGHSVSSAGDVDGDGYDDVVVGAYRDDDNGTESGSVYVYYGTSTGIYSTFMNKIVASDGATDDYFGCSVSGAGDVDGDGYDDVVVGAYYDDYTGSVYVYYGASTGIDSASEDKVVASDGAGGDRFGDSVSGVGDVDGDGYDDLAVGAHKDDDNGFNSGSTYVYYGGCRDLDGDGFECDVDCDDSDASTWPGAAQLDSTTGCMTDADGDGHGDASPAAGVTVGTDCDDSDPASFPGATEETGDEVDQDCDGAEICYADADDDGYTDGATTVSSTDTDCTDAGEGLATDETGDCDDGDADTWPGAALLDSTADCMTDADGDGYGDDSPATGVTAGTDCDDRESAFSPGADEVCDGFDNNCDGLVDPDDSSDAMTWYADLDGDGFGDPLSAVSACEQPTASVVDDTDCDDADGETHPGAAEIVGDGIDQDCDGSDAPEGAGGCGGCAAGANGVPSGVGFLLVLGLVGLGRRRDFDERQRL